MKSRMSFLRVSALLAMACILGAPSVWTQTDGSLQSSVSFNAVRYHVEPGRTRIWFETSGTVLYTQ